MRPAARLAAAHVQLLSGNHLVALRHAQGFLGSASEAAAAERANAHCLAAECLALAGRHGEAADAHLVQAVEAAVSGQAVDVQPDVQQELREAAARLHECAASLLLAAGGADRQESAAKHAAAAQVLQPDSQAAALLALQARLLAGDTAGALQMLRTQQSEHAAGAIQAQQ